MPHRPDHGLSAPQVDRGTDLADDTVAFVLEQALGHVTHAANLMALMPAEAPHFRIDPQFLPISFDAGRASRVPGWSNWTVRAGVRARRALNDLARVQPPAAVFVHTQVPAALLGSWIDRLPTVVSLDATPRQYDLMGTSYAHRPGPQLIERLKHRHQTSIFQRASRLVTWSSWARDDLVATYGVDPDRVTVISPGVNIEVWQQRHRSDDEERPLEVLFVGGDLERKGGNLLIEACARLRSEPSVPNFELHIVTTADVTAGPGVSIHRGVKPNSPELIERFRDADVFCLPTLGDCFAMVLSEAGAAGLPLVATDVGAIPSIVQQGVTGELLPPGDIAALTAALRRLLTDPARRIELGSNARALVEQHHDARVNASRILEVVRSALDDPG